MKELGNTEKEEKNKKTRADKIVSTNTEIKYSLSELEQAANTFGVKPECVRAAFLVAGSTKATQKEAQSIIKNFMSREVY